MGWDPPIPDAPVDLVPNERAGVILPNPCYLKHISKGTEPMLVGRSDPCPGAVSRPIVARPAGLIAVSISSAPTSSGSTEAPQAHHGGWARQYGKLPKSPSQDERPSTVAALAMHEAR
jgi:hypothetical protein